MTIVAAILPSVVTMLHVVVADDDVVSTSIAPYQILPVLRSLFMYVVNTEAITDDSYVVVVATSADAATTVVAVAAADVQDAMMLLQLN